MERMRFIISTLLLLFLSHAAFACLCSAPLPVSDELKVSTSVFTGKALSIGGQYGPDYKLIEFQVLRVWKGPKVDRLEVRTAALKNDCGYAFAKGAEYLVYASGDKVLQVSACSRTERLEKAAGDVRKLMTLAQSTWVGPVEANRDPFAVAAGDHLNTQRSKIIPNTLTVSSAVVIGIISQKSEYTALIRSADGKAYTMKVGDRLYDGTIAAIDDDSVTFLQNGKRIKKQLRVVKE